MPKLRLTVTEQRELRHLSAVRAAGGSLPLITGARPEAGIDGRSARALAGKEFVSLAPVSGRILCSLTASGTARLSELEQKSGGASRAAAPSERLEFDTHLPNLLREVILGHSSPGPLVMAMNLTVPIIKAVAQRAIELDDPTLNILMLRLALYEVPPAERLSAIEAQRTRLRQQTLLDRLGIEEHAEVFPAERIEAVARAIVETWAARNSPEMEWEHLVHGSEHPDEFPDLAAKHADAIAEANAVLRTLSHQA